MADEGKPNRGRNSVRGLKRGANFYFEACVFDLMTTGDVWYASSARGAWNDVTRFHESGSNARATSLDPVNEWKPAPTVKPLTELPKTVEMSSENSITLRPNPIKTKSPPGNGVSSNSHQLNVTVLLFCLLANSGLVNLVNLYNFFEKINNKFSNLPITTWRTTTDFEFSLFSISRCKTLQNHIIWWSCCSWCLYYSYIVIFVSSWFLIYIVRFISQIVIIILILNFLMFIFEWGLKRINRVTSFVKRVFLYTSALQEFN